MDGGGEGRWYIEKQENGGEQVCGKMTKSKIIIIFQPILGKGSVLQFQDEVGEGCSNMQEILVWH